MPWPNASGVTTGEGSKQNRRGSRFGLSRLLMLMVCSASQQAASFPAGGGSGCPVRCVPQ